MPRHPKRSRSERLGDILEWGAKTARYIDGMSASRTRHPDLELSAARAMRNRLSHGYFDIDVQVVWDTATVDVPKIVDAARRALAAEDGS